MTDIEVEFKARMECGLLRGMMAGIATLTDEVKLEIDRKRWHVKCVDPAHVAMLEVEIPVELFEDYKCSQEGGVGIGAEKLLDMMRYMKDSDIVEVRSGTGHRSNRIIVSDGLSVSSTKPVDTIGMSDPKVPNLNLPIKFTIPWKVFGDTLKRAERVSDHVFIKAYEGGLELFAEGDIDDFSRMFPKDTTDLIDYNATSEILKKCGSFNDSKEQYSRNIYPHDYLSYPFLNSKSRGFKTWFNKSKWLEVCNFSMSTDYPIRIEAERNGVRFLYLLAPRIEPE